MEILVFGQLTDVVRTPVLQLDDLQDLVALRKVLYARYPALVNSHFIIAVNGKIHDDDQPIPAGAKLALLPPFSGG